VAAGVAGVGKLPLKQVIHRRVCYLIVGGVFGSAAFVEKSMGVMSIFRALTVLYVRPLQSRLLQVMKNSSFPIHTPENAPEASRKLLLHTRENFGMVPNLEGVMAAAPALLKSYVSMWDGFENTSLTPIERQIVYQTVNFENTCNYCVPWHTLLSRQAGMSEGDIEALRSGSPLADPKHEALRLFTREVVMQNGKVTAAAISAFFEAGYTRQTALEVVMGIAIKTMSNYTNSIAGTPLDAAVEKFSWKKPLADGSA
jgi:AhpD family alkylhydroperoxidase